MAQGKAPLSRSRRQLLKALAAAAVAGTLFEGVVHKGQLSAMLRRPLAGRLTGATASLGHRLRQHWQNRSSAQPSLAPTWPTSEQTIYDCVIVGGGISGLATAYQLQKQGLTHFALLDLEDEVGGNARSGANTVSAFPLAAHYVPVLSDEVVEIHALFEELGIIPGYHVNEKLEKVAIYNEYYVCQDPQERLYFKGTWQEGLLPLKGVDLRTRQQYDAFFAQMKHYKWHKGSDGRYAFAIPVDLSSTDPALLQLDTLTMAAWMDAQGYDSPYLLWYVDYCCRDDFGTTITQVSAWAAIHYFCARRGRAFNADDSSDITWPEGNGWLVKRLSSAINKASPSALKTNCLVHQVTQLPQGFVIDYWNTAAPPAQSQPLRVYAKTVVLAVPQFIGLRLLGKTPLPFSYAPWAVANITLDAIPQGQPMPLCWDNVIFDSPTLGYVVATHQHTDMKPTQTVLTFYWALDEGDPITSRKQALDRPLAQWQQAFVDELLRVHPELASHIVSVDVALWGHAMVRPTPNVIWGDERQKLCSMQPPLFYAHSDRSGMSLFEEAYTHGCKSAQGVAHYLAKHT